MTDPQDHKPQGAAKIQKARKSRQLRYLAQSVRLEEAVAPKIVRMTILVVAAGLLCFIIWASVTRVEEISRVQGEVIPLGFQQVVQHLEGGLIRDINVKEGYTVEKGDVLVVLDSIDVKKDLERTQSKLISLQLQEIRLAAQASGDPPDFDAYLADFPIKVAEQAELYSAAVESEEKEREVLMDQISQRRNAIETLNTRMATTINNLRIVKSLYDTRKQLKADGVISEVRFLETKQRLNDLKGEVENLQSQIKAADIALTEFERRLESLDAKNRDEDLQSLEKVKEELIQTREILAKLEDRSQRLEIRAPEHGIVKGLSVNTIGSVVQPGQVLMEIVPLGRELVILIRIPPDIIGYINIGDRVRLKVSTYDFSKYGTVTGTLEYISATTFADDGGSSYYNGRIVLDRNYVGTEPKNRVLPGMTVVADIIIGRKTIMQYLFKPIHQSLKTAFTEQ